MPNEVSAEHRFDRRLANRGLSLAEINMKHNCGAAREGSRAVPDSA